MSFLQCFTYKQTWAFAAGKFMTDGVWWFFLFWTPSYLNTQFDIKTSDGLGMALIFTLYAVTMLSIYGGKLPTIFRILPIGSIVVTAVRNTFSVVPGYFNRYRWSGSPIMVGQYLLYGRRYVPKNRNCKYYRYRRYGRWRRFYAYAIRCRRIICAC